MPTCPIPSPEAAYAYVHWLAVELKAAKQLLRTSLQCQSNREKPITLNSNTIIPAGAAK